MKFTLSITGRCNLRCRYCYITKNDTVISLETARKAVDFIFDRTPDGEKVEIGFFGGEPLLEFERVREITDIIERHPSFSSHDVELTVVTNGTIFSDEIAEFLLDHGILLCVSCDGPPHVQDANRAFANGKGSSDSVTKTLLQASNILPLVMVNAVFGPDTVEHLPGTVRFLSSLGLRQLYLNPDFSASWTEANIGGLEAAYADVAKQYTDFYLSDNPHFISLIDSKITVILRGGYASEERCQMGIKVFAISPLGNIYPCERLIGNDSKDHRIGNLTTGIMGVQPACRQGSIAKNQECLSCSVNQYCMNWCGCSNYFSSGSYDSVGPFLCASEKVNLEVAFETFRILEKKMGYAFFEHLSSIPSLNAHIRKSQ